MAKSLYGFAAMADTSGSGATAAIRLYTRAIAQGAGKTGVIENPDIFRQAREAYLAPLADDVRVSTKIAESTNDENRLRDKLSDVGLVASKFREDVSDLLSGYAKQDYRDPSKLIANTSFVYNAAVDTLAEEIESRKATGQGIGELQTMLRDYSDRADKMSRLTRQVMTMGKPQNPNAVGWFVKTNPDDGSIVGIEIDSADSTDKRSGYTRTSSYYGGVPVWANTAVDENGNVVARIGNNSFKLEDNVDGGKVLRNVGSTFGGYFRAYVKASLAVVPGGKTPSQAFQEGKDEARKIDLSGIQFGDVLQLPRGSIAKDARGNYYLYSSDGVYKATSRDTLSKFLSASGSNPGDIDEKAFPISRSEVDSIGPFVGPDGKSRIIDDSFMGGVGGQATGTIPSLPGLDRSVSGTIPVAPGPSQPSPVSSTEPFIVPRKKPGIQEPTQGGIADFMSTQQRKFSSPGATAQFTRRPTGA